MENTEFIKQKTLTMRKKLFFLKKIENSKQEICREVSTRHYLTNRRFSSWDKRGKRRRNDQQTNVSNEEILWEEIPVIPEHAINKHTILFCLF